MSDEIIDKVMAYRESGKRFASIDEFRTVTGMPENDFAQLAGRFRSKQEILQRLRGFIDDSNVQATLQIEKSMLRLVSELENVKGRLRVQRERAAQAPVASLAIRRNRRQPVETAAKYHEHEAGVGCEVAR